MKILKELLESIERDSTSDRFFKDCATGVFMWSNWDATEDGEGSDYHPTENLLGCPKVVNGDFDIAHNATKSLLYGPVEVKGKFGCEHNTLIKSLEGCPRKVLGDFDCSNTGITSLENVSDSIDEIRGVFSIRQCNIQSGGAGLLLVKGISFVDARKCNNRVRKAFKIINTYIEKGGDYSQYFYDCQKELIDKGFEEFARI